MSDLVNNASCSTDVRDSSGSSCSSSDQSDQASEDDWRSDHERGSGESERHHVHTDDSSEAQRHHDALHDDAADSEDEAWVNRHLRRNSSCDGGEESVQCACCFAVLSVRCQRHERYEGQFRALFVLNCEVVHSQTLKISGERAAHRDELFTPVACSSCHTEVGVLDASGVYHFCNVMY